MIKCNAIFVTALTLQETVKAEFRDMVGAWAREHGSERVTLNAMHHPGANGYEVSYVTRVTDCFVDEIKEVNEDGFIMVGDYQAYCADITYAGPSAKDITSAEHNQGESVGSALAALLNEMFTVGKFTEQDQQRVLDMSLRDFLGHCFIADVNFPPEEPKSYGISKKSLLTGQLVKCPICHEGRLSIREGIVMCPRCQFSLGDIDDLPELI